MDFSTAAAALQKRGYKVSVFETAAQAAAYLNEQIDGTSVGFGGSVTLHEMGLHESLSRHNTLISHWDLTGDMTAGEAKCAAMTADVYLTSANGLAETGEIINIDGGGNRVSASLFGHKKVYFVVGRNKLAPTYDEALWRARNIAAPKNAQRLKRRTPCAVKGDRCYDCKSPDRICCALVVLWRNMLGGDAEVVLIDEDLGY